ncbi:MAG TPA: hypothetical protein VLM85_12530, partial [Polyangiaceae bacterium]|nr:hypothetical protein [Polyangiaceae bacterium]
DDTKPGTDERRHAERLYRRALAGRAYRRAADGRTADARADFDAIASKTGSLESIIGSIELRLRSEKADGIRADYEARSATLSAPTLAFVRAYLLAADLPSLEGKAFDKSAADAIASLRGQWPELKNKRAVRALYGSVLHQMFLRTGDLALAARANVHYLVALDLVGRNARYRAMMLNDLGMLHAAVGNYQMGLAYLTRRAELPYVDDAPSLTTRMTEARALLHAGREADAAKVADDALAMIERAPALAEYRVLALDRAALYNLAAGRFDRSLALYDALTPLVDAPTAKGSNARRNRFVTHLARAAATLGAKKPERALADLAIVEPALRDPTMRDVLQWPHASSDHVMSSYGAITAGLRANAYGALGNLDLQARAMQDRRALFAERFQRSQRNEYLRALSLVESRLADNSAARNDPKAAGGWVSAALAHADDLRARSTEVSPRVQLDVVWLAAELSLFTNAPLSFDLQKRLETARADAAHGSDPTLRGRASWLDVYQVLTSPK